MQDDDGDSRAGLLGDDASKLICRAGGFDQGPPSSSHFKSKDDWQSPRADHLGWENWWSGFGAAPYRELTESFANRPARLQRFRSAHRWADPEFTA